MLGKIVSSVLVVVGSIGVTMMLALAVSPQRVASPTRQMVRMEEIVVTPVSMPTSTFSVEFTEAEAMTITPPAEIRRQS